MSIRPNAATVSTRAESTASGSVTSQTMAIALPPAASMSAAVFPTVSSTMSTQATAAPSAP